MSAAACVVTAIELTTKQLGNHHPFFFHAIKNLTFRHRSDPHSTAEREKFECPKAELTANYKTLVRYDMIEEDGLPTPGDMVTENTVIIGKTAPLPTPPADPKARAKSIDRSQLFIDERHVCKDQSVTPRKNCGGFVQEVNAVHARDNVCVSVTIRSHLKPEIGDKFAARHGQKGIIARIVDDDEMPMALDGTIPNLIMNPHAYPSRMTIGQTMEGALGNISALTGVRRDATMFFSPSREQLESELFELGQNPTCEKRFIDPKTGEIMTGSMYEGVVYYQRLRHLVNDKVHARARGPITKATKQPNEGRRRNGALRIGEMENTTMVAHGASAVGEERLHLVSDAFKWPVCMKCGTGSSAHRVQTNYRTFLCKRCDSHDNIKEETLPYPMKQLVHYLYGCGVSVTFGYGDGENTLD